MESVGPDATRWMTTESEQKSAHRFLEAHAEAHLQMQFVYRDGWDDYYRLKSAASPVCETEATIYDAIVAACKGEEKGLTVTHKLTPEGPIYETGRPLELSEVVQSNYLFYNFGSPLMFAACYPGTFVVDWEQGSISLRNWTRRGIQPEPAPGPTLTLRPAEWERQLLNITIDFMSGKPELSISQIGRFLSNWRTRITSVFGDYKTFFSKYPDIFVWRLEGTNIRAALLYGTKANTLRMTKLPELVDVGKDEYSTCMPHQARKKASATVLTEQLGNQCPESTSETGEYSEGEEEEAHTLPSSLGNYTIELIETAEACVGACATLMGKDILAVDCEGLVSQQKPEFVQVLGCSASGDPLTPVYIFKTLRGPPQMLPLLSSVLDNRVSIKLFHDSRHDICALKECNIEVHNMMDTLVMHAALQQLRRVAGLPVADTKPPRLEQLIPTHGQADGRWLSAATRIKKRMRARMETRGSVMWSQVKLSEEMLEYAAFDVVVLPIIWKHLREETARTADQMYKLLSELFADRAISLQHLPNMFK